MIAGLRKCVRMEANIRIQVLEPVDSKEGGPKRISMLGRGKLFGNESEIYFTWKSDARGQLFRIELAKPVIPQG